MISAIKFHKLNSMVSKVLLSKLDWVLGTIDVIWDNIAALIEFRELSFF